MEAGVDPAFEELNEQESAPALSEGVSRVAREAAGRGFAGFAARVRAAGVARFVGRFAALSNNCSGPGWKLVEWRDYPAPWRREPFAREEEIDTLVRMVRELAEMSSRPRRVTDNLYQGSGAGARAGRMDRAGGERGRARLRRARRPAAEARARSAARSDERVGRVWRRRGARGAGARSAMNCCDGSRNSGVRADADLAAVLREEMRGLVEEYEQRKQRAGQARLRRSADAACAIWCAINADVRRYLQNRFTHLFIDEFQDTDPLQVGDSAAARGGRSGGIGLAKRGRGGKAVSGGRSRSNRFTSSGGRIWCCTGRCGTR